MTIRKSFRQRIRASRGDILMRQNPKRTAAFKKTFTNKQAANAIYAYLLSDWEALSDDNKRALGYDVMAGNEGEEQALGQLGRLLMSCADLTFRRALVARRKRLGIED